MATYYWVGGSGTWDTTTTNWSLTSGGAGGAGFPTSADDVIIDAASSATTFTITFGTTVNCKNWTITGLTATNKVTLNGSGGINVYGSLDFQAGSTGIVSSSITGLTLTGTLNFLATTTGNIVNFNGIVCNSQTYFNGVGGEWTLTSNLVCTYGAVRQLYILAGSLNTNNFAITNFFGILSTGTLTRSISLGSSIITCRSSVTGQGGYSWQMIPTGLTLDAGTSTINITNTSTGTSVTNFVGGGFTYNNVAITTNSATVNFLDENTFANLTIPSSTNTGVRFVTFNSNQTITGTLTINGSTDPRFRTSLQSDTLGTQRTLTVNSIAAGVQNIDFQDIAIAGAAAPLSGTYLGNAGNNSGITFDAEKDCYLVATTTAGSASTFAPTSGGTGAATSFPLPQDNVIFDNSTPASVSFTQASLSGLGGFSWGSLNISTRTSAISIATGSQSSYSVLKNFTLSATTTITGSSTIFLNGHTDSFITTNNAAINNSAGITINRAPGTSITLLDNLTISGNLSFAGGTFRLNDYTINTAIFLSTSSNSRILNFGTNGVFNITGNNTTPLLYLNGTNFVLVGTTKEFNLTYSGATGTRYISAINFTQGNAINLNIIGGSDNVVPYYLSGNTNIFNNITFIGYTGTFTLGSSTNNVTIYGNLTLSAGQSFSSIGGNLTFAGTGTKTITTNGVPLSSILVSFATAGGIWNLQDNFTNTLEFNVASGTVNTNNFTLNVGAFSTAVNGTINLGTSTVNATNGNGTVLSIAGGNINATGTPTFNLTYSGSVGARSATGRSTCNINVTAGTDTISILSAVKNLNFTGFSGAYNASNSLTVYGDYTLSTGMSINGGNGTTTFAGNGITQLITFNGKTLDVAVSISCTNLGTVKLVDDFTIGSTRGLALVSGTFDANNKNVSVGSFSGTGSVTRTLTMGSGTWTLSGTATVWNLSTSTNLTFNVNTANIILSSTSTVARTFSGGNSLVYNTITIGGTTGISTTTISNASVIGTLASTKTVAHTILFAANPTIKNWNITGTAGNVVTVNSSVTGTQRTINFTGSKTTMDYMSFKDIYFAYTLGPTGPYRIYAGANSTNGGNNGGIAFIDGTTQTAYLLVSGTSWNVPADWNNSNNAIHMIGAGGGGGTSVISGSNRAAGGGGGGAGYTIVTNQTLSGTVPYTIGTSSANTNGGNTTFNTTNIAGGGQKGNATTTPTSSGGAGGTGMFAGGSGGAGAFDTITNSGYGAGGGGGAGGPNGVGGNGGNGFGSTTSTNISGGGGGGNGGGSNGTDGISALGGNGGNNFNGVGSGVGGTSGAGSAGTFGGGGGGGVTTTTGVGGSGGYGIDILNTIGGAGGGGGWARTVTGGSNAGLYGGGGSGGAVGTGGSIYAGSAGSQGVIFIVYTPIVVYNKSFFSLFESAF